MKRFTDEHGNEWLATVAEEKTPRHHGRWYMVFEQPGAGEQLPVPEVRWQTAASGARTLATMSDFELRRRLQSAQLRFEEA